MYFKKYMKMAPRLPHFVKHAILWEHCLTVIALAAFSFQHLDSSNVLLQLDLQNLIFSKIVQIKLYHKRDEMCIEAGEFNK